MEMKHNETIIIGAGFTGTALGNLLKSHGKNPLILEKSRGIGGRLATRRIDGQGLDHGAPFLDSIPISGGMSTYVKSIAENLQILKDQKVDKIFKDSIYWRLTTEAGAELRCNHLILTAPLPQAAELLKTNELISFSHPLFEVKYSKALVLLVTAKEIPLNLTSGHSYYLMRERRLHPQGIVIHLSDSQADEYFEQSDEAIVSFFMKLIAESPLSELHIEKFELKKWRYSQALNLYPASYLEVQPNLFLCGDGFGDPLMSAKAVAEKL